MLCGVKKKKKKTKPNNDKKPPQNNNKNANHTVENFGYGLLKTEGGRGVFNTEMT